MRYMQLHIAGDGGLTWFGPGGRKLFACKSALERHYLGVATIQIRDISEEAYEVIRRRARNAGQSIQGYMKRQIERLAREPDEDALFDEVEHFVEAHGIRLDIESVLSDLDAERR